MFEDKISLNISVEWSADAIKTKKRTHFTEMAVKALLNIELKRYLIL